MEICKTNNVELIHRPILLSPVVEAQRSMPFRARTQAHVDYFFGREIERWAEFRNVDIVNYRPTYHDADYSLASGMIITLGETGDATDQMAHSLLEAHWRDDIDLSDPQALKELASQLGHQPEGLLESAASEEIQRKLQANTGRALAASIFGSPTYIVDGDQFYGQDRLELVERALQKRFQPSTWRNPSVDETQ